MQYRTFGVHNARVSILGFGCGRIGSFNNPATDRDTMRLLERALDLGVTLFDTADIYGQGDSERAIGRLLRNRRGKGFVVTKVGNLFSAKMRLLLPLKPVLKPIIAMSSTMRSKVTDRRGASMETDFSPPYLVSGLEASLRRLRMDNVDVLLLHSPPKATVEDPAVADALCRMRDSGKVTAYGVACDDAASLSAALRMPGLAVVEVTKALADGLSDGERALVASNRIGILIREVVRDRTFLSPAQAVSEAAKGADVASVVVGTTSMRHLEDLAAAMSPTAG